MGATDDIAVRWRQQRVTRLVTGSTVWLVVLCGLVYYKWGGAETAIAGVRASGRWSGTAQALTMGGTLPAFAFYFRRIWIALVFGLVIAAMVRAFVSPRRIVVLFGRDRLIRSQLACGLAGAPLMLCSCCVTPIFQSVYETGARLSSAVTVMLASPGLNPAALLLTFLLFPAKLAWARLCGALAATLLLPPLLEAMSGKVRERSLLVDDSRELDDSESLRGAAVSFIRALWHISQRTIPYIVIGVVVSSLIVPWTLSLSTGGPILVGSVAALAVVISLPTFFEFPFALLLMSAGSPGAAAAMLIAGPIINLPSLIIFGRETSLRAAAGLAVGVWLIALLAALGVS